MCFNTRKRLLKQNKIQIDSSDDVILMDQSSSFDLHKLKIG